MATPKPTEQLLRTLRGFQIVDPPPTFIACDRVLNFILGNLGQSREAPASRAARYLALQRRYCGKRVRYASGATGVVAYLTVRTPTERLQFRKSEQREFGPIVARIQFDSGTSMTCSLDRVYLLEPTT